MSTQTSLTNPDYNTPTTPVGTLNDTHELSKRARDYGEQVIRNTDWPLEHVDLEKLSWETSTRAKKRHGLASYNYNNEVTITISEHTYNRAGFEACKDTIRHELVHAWQYQNSGELAIITDNGLQDSTIGDKTFDEKWSTLETRYENPDDTDVVKITAGHGASFKNWVPALDLDGRCSNHYTKTRSDYEYVCECPNCGAWWGKHRMCKTVRQSATGHRVCCSCKVDLRLRVENMYMQLGRHTDEQIKQFTGNAGSNETIDTIRDKFGVSKHDLINSKDYLSF